MKWFIAVLVALLVYFGLGWVIKDITYSMMNISDKATLEEIANIDLIVYAVLAGVYIILCLGYLMEKVNDSDELFNKYIKEQFIVNDKGQRIEGNAFNVDIKEQYNVAADKREFPVFVADVDGATKYILPIYGAGLWGPIWGYISLDADKSTIYGTFFDHQGETPGLGAEITTPAFNNQFQNKQIFSGEELVSILVIKGGNATGKNEVDAISGGTITSKGVENMLRNYLTYYEPFLKQK